MKQVKIVSFWLTALQNDDGSWEGWKGLPGISTAERQLAKLLNEGWQIASSGGGGESAIAFVVLIREP